MFPTLPNLLAALSAQDVTRFRFIAMLSILVGGLTSGYLASNRFGLSEKWAKKLMTIVVVSFNWLITLFIIWKIPLNISLIWLPTVALVLMATVTVITAIISHFLKLDQRSQLTFILAGGLSNHAYTGGAFVCYALFGTIGLGLANIFLVFWWPVIYFVFFPLLKIYEMRTSGPDIKLDLKQILDPRFLVIPAVIVALILNLTNVKYPQLINKLYLVDIFVYIASSLSFFSIGLRLKVSRLKNYINLYFPLIAVKFVITPALAFLLLWILAATGQNLDPLAQKVIIVLSLTPSAVLMVTMSNVFDLDAPLASALWVVTMAIFAIIIVPLLFIILA